MGSSQVQSSCCPYKFEVGDLKFTLLKGLTKYLVTRHTTRNKRETGGRPPTIPTAADHRRPVV